MKTKDIAKEYNISQSDFENFITKNEIPCTYGAMGIGMLIPDEQVKELVTWYVNFYTENKKNELAKEQVKVAELEAKRKAKLLVESEQRLAFANMLFTTGYQYEGYKITKYLDIVSADTVLGTGMLSEFGASVSDLFGVESNLFGEKIQQARESAQQKLRRIASLKGANAVIGIDFDYIVLAQNMIGVSVTGTAVVIEKIEETQM